MSDIFAEVDADLRRDRWQALWDRYGLLVICGAVGIVLLVAIFVGYRAFQQSQNEAASLRYEALLQQISEEEAGAQFEVLNSFAREETNGYGVLAAFGAARAAAENGDFTAALAGFDALAAR
ncbi:MAG: tetratricopeptide repeat protein, partial [Pseudomonadota bacterium]|nr:tetratricopeptide repeat protein [Pseudomonadota bacterium]